MCYLKNNSYSLWLSSMRLISIVHISENVLSSVIFNTVFSVDKIIPVVCRVYVRYMDGDYGIGKTCEKGSHKGLD